MKTQQKVITPRDFWRKAVKVERVIDSCITTYHYEAAKRMVTYLAKYTPRSKMYIIEDFRMRLSEKNPLLGYLS